MKSAQKLEHPSVVVALAYYDGAKRFMGGFANGIIGIFDENVMEECPLMRILEQYNQHPELLDLKFLESTKTVVTAGKNK